MFYLVFSIFSLGTAMLQSSYLRAPKGIVPTRRRRLYTVVAAVATLIQVLSGWLYISPGVVGALVFVPIFYAVNRGLQMISLRLRYTFRIGLALVLLSAYPMIHPLVSDAWSALSI
jgi:hypothetical protein